MPYDAGFGSSPFASERRQMLLVAVVVPPTRPLPLPLREALMEALMEAPREKWAQPAPSPWGERENEAFLGHRNEAFSAGLQGFAA